MTRFRLSDEATGPSAARCGSGVHCAAGDCNCVRGSVCDSDGDGAREGGGVIDDCDVDGVEGESGGRSGGGSLESAAASTCSGGTMNRYSGT